MAFAFRHPDQARRILIRLDNELPPSGAISISLAVDRTAYGLEGSKVDGILILVENSYNTLEAALLGAGPSAYVGIVVTDADSQGILLTEPLSFHLSFFGRFFDFAHDDDIYTVRGSYAKTGSLAIFTHVYNENSMLKVWEKFYSRIVPLTDLFVIDHGSTSDPRQVLSPGINIISVPRGPVDHRAISHFCNTFQRFLLSQYEWVLHVDADELLVHARGWDYFSQSLLARRDKVIIKAAHGYNLTHDVASEAALDLSVPLGLQRRHLVSVPIYAKPVLSSIPTTWRIGFHLVLETHALVEDPELWLIHLSYVDLGLHLEKSRKWSALDVAETERRESPHLYDRPATTTEPARQVFSDLLAAGPVIPVPDWMRGMF